MHGIAYMAQFTVHHKDGRYIVELVDGVKYRIQERDLHSVLEAECYKKYPENEGWCHHDVDITSTWKYR